MTIDDDEINSEIEIIFRLFMIMFTYFLQYILDWNWNIYIYTMYYIAIAAILHIIAMLKYK